MITRRTFVSGSAALGGSALALSACDSSSSDDGVDVSTLDKGAMEDYAAGTQFKATEPLEVTTLFSDQPTYPYSKDWLFWSEVTKRCNVTFKSTVIPASDYEQKRSLLVSAGDAPMIIPKTYPGQETAYVSSGSIIAVSDYVEHMPNFQKKVADWKLEDEIETLKQADGKYYVLPGLHEELWPDYSLAYRTDVFEELKLSEPETWEDLLDVMRTLRKEKPDAWPLSDQFTGLNLLNLVATSYGVGAGWGLGDGVIRAEEGSDELIYGPVQDRYEEFVSLLAKAVDEDLLDPESFSQKDDAAQQKFVTGNAMMISVNAQQVTQYRDTMNEELGEGKFGIKKMLLPTGPAGPVMGGSRLENGIMLNSTLEDNENFLAILQFVDWLWYSDAGQEFTKWGVEGVTYEKKDGAYELAKDVNFLGLNPGGKKDLRKDFGFSVGNFSYGGTTKLLQSVFDDEEKEWQKAMAESRQPTEPKPVYPFDEDQIEQASLITTPLNDLVDQNTLKFITGKRDLDQWDAYTKELNSNGADKYLTMAKDAQKTFQQKNG